MAKAILYAILVISSFVSAGCIYEDRDRDRHRDRDRISDEREERHEEHHEDRH